MFLAFIFLTQIVLRADDGLFLRNGLLVKNVKLSLPEKCPCSEFSDSHFPVYGLNTERCGVSVRMRENMGHKNSERGHFSPSVYLQL